MAVGTTRPTVGATWGAISDQTTVYLSHDGGADIELAIKGSAPAETVSGAVMRFKDKLIYRLAASEFVYARCTSENLANPPILTVMQSART